MRQCRSAPAVDRSRRRNHSRSVSNQCVQRMITGNQSAEPLSTASTASKIELSFSDFWLPLPSRSNSSSHRR